MDEEIQDDYIQENTTPVSNWDSGNGSAEKILERPTMDKVFNSEDVLYNIEKQFRGYQKQDGEWIYVTRPIARDEFINSTINSLRSIINDTHKISAMTSDDIKFILLEKNKQFIFSCLDEPTLDDEDLENVVNIYDHALQVFMGIVEGGIGNKTIRELGAAVANDWDKYKKDEGWGINVNDKNLISIGGRARK